MKVGLRFWIASGSLIFLCIAFIVAAYHFDWTGTGFENKTLWDWLQLLIIPLALAIIALLYNLASTRTEQKIATQRYEQDKQITKEHYEQDKQITKERYEQDKQIAKERYEQDQQIALDKQREDLLQTYLDRMSELLLEKQLATTPTDEVRNVARVRAITILFQLDARRIGYVFAFLKEAGLMSTASESIVSLQDANLSNINFSQAMLAKADLRKANLSEANLSEAILLEANLSGADLSGANLSGAILSEAKMQEVIGLTAQELEKCKSQGAII